jgi:hypothetical protein
MRLLLTRDRAVLTATQHHQERRTAQLAASRAKKRLSRSQILLARIWRKIAVTLKMLSARGFERN